MSIRNNFKIKNRTLINQILDCSNSKKINLKLIKVKSYSKDKQNNKADKLAKEGLCSENLLEIQNVITGNIGVVPMWKGKLVKRPLRSFVNLTTVTIYENSWADLSSIRTLLNYRSNSIEASKLNWRNIWTVLKRFQGKKCTSMK